MNRRAKLLLGEEIRKPTNTHTHKEGKQTVTDISTPCLSACLENNIKNVASGEVMGEKQRHVDDCE